MVVMELRWDIIQCIHVHVIKVHTHNIDRVCVCVHADNYTSRASECTLTSQPSLYVPSDSLLSMVDRSMGFLTMSK